MSLRSLTRKDVMQLAGSHGLFRRAEEYCNTGKIFRYSVLRNVITAGLHGNYGDYTVRISPASGNPDEIDYKCDCPSNRDVCKHIVAVLLHYLKEGRQSAETPVQDLPAALTQTLEEMSQKELLGLVLKLAGERADFRRTILENVSYSHQIINQQPREPELVKKLKKKITDFFKETVKHPKEDGNGEGPELTSLFETTKSLNPLDQVEVYWQIITTGNRTLKSDSHNTAEIEKAIRLYGEAVSKQNLKPEGKKPYFDSLLKAAALDIKRYDGVVKALKGALDRIISSPEDYRYLIKKIEKSKRLEVDEWLASYYLKIGDDENYLRVRQKNLETESQFLDLAGYWRSKGDEKRYIETLEKWVSRISSRKAVPKTGPQQESILSILTRHYKSRSDDANLYRILMETARQNELSMDLYKQIETISKRLNRWEESQPILIKYAKKSPDLMARIFLYEKDWEAVIRLAKGIDHFENVKALIAKGIKDSRPKEAIRIYKGVVQGYIDERSREHYKLAARYAEEIRSIYFNVLKDRFGWQSYIDQIRKAYVKLPALQDEFSGL